MFVCIWCDVTLYLYCCLLLNCVYNSFCLSSGTGEVPTES
jgi:hypothetical protein